MTNTKTPIEQMQDVLRGSVLLLDGVIDSIDNKQARNRVRLVAARLAALTGLMCKWCGANQSRLVVRGEMSTFTRYRCADCMAEFDLPKAAKS
jgi:transposase-like protein